MAIMTEQRTYVAGRWVTGIDTVVVENPADETTVAEITATPEAGVRTAITEARRCFDEGRWAGTAPADRAAVLHTFLDYVESQRDVVVPTLVAEAGQPTSFADLTQFTGGLALARNAIDLHLSMSHEDFNPVPVDELVRGRVALSVRR